MCTAIHFSTKDHYFGRNLDLEYSFLETVVVTPRNYPFPFRKVDAINSHYAIIGMAYVPDNYPLYYDATNEKGLSIAGLHFPGNATYLEYQPGMLNITPFELIPWILGQCASVKEALHLLSKVNLLNEDYSPKLPLSPLHWLLADEKESIVIEPLADGLNIYPNPVGVLTNNPPFDQQLKGLKDTDFLGDWSSTSRFSRAVFVKQHAQCDASEHASVSQFFHILGSVEQPRGCVKVGEDFKITHYSSCCNTDKGVYYYRTYDNSQISAISMYKEDINGQELAIYPLQKEQQIHWQN